MTNESEPSCAAHSHRVESSGEMAQNKLRRFVLRSAKGSCYLSLALYALGFVSALSPMLFVGCVLIELAAFMLGLVGVIGGIACKAPVAIRVGTLGVLLSGIPFAVLTVLAFR